MININRSFNNSIRPGPTCFNKTETSSTNYPPSKNKSKLSPNKPITSKSSTIPSSMLLKGFSHLKLFNRSLPSSKRVSAHPKISAKHSMNS